MSEEEKDIKIAIDKFLDNKDIDSAVLIVEQFVLGNYILVGGRKNIVKDSLRYILSDYKRLLKENGELKKYDIRNIKIDKDKIISSPSFTRKEVDLMNLGIALSLNADKLFNEEIEEDDI